jgi:hypothetical protein
LRRYLAVCQSGGFDAVSYVVGDGGVYGKQIFGHEKTVPISVHDAQDSGIGGTQKIDLTVNRVRYNMDAC